MKGILKSASAPSLCQLGSGQRTERVNSAASFNRRHALLSSLPITTVCSKTAHGMLRDALIYFGTSADWHCNQDELASGIDACLHAKQALSPVKQSDVMFSIHLLLSTAMSFYENLANDRVDLDHTLLTMTLRHYGEILQNLTSRKVCSDQALHNFAIIGQMMKRDLPGAPTKNSP
jgi:hypothetical protein